MAHKIIQDIFNSRSLNDYSIIRIISNILNCIFVSLAWVFFKANTVADAIIFLKQIGNNTGLFYINVYVVGTLILMILANIYSICYNNGNAIQIRIDLDKVWGKIVISAWFFAILMLMYVGNQNFIYAQF